MLKSVGTSALPLAGTLVLIALKIKIKTKSNIFLQTQILHHGTQIFTFLSLTGLEPKPTSIGLIGQLIYCQTTSLKMDGINSENEIPCKIVTGC